MRGVFRPEAELMLFRRMHTKEIAKNIANMYFDRRVSPLLQEIGVAEAKVEVRFLTESSEIGFLRMRSEHIPKTRLLYCQIATMLAPL